MTATRSNIAARWAGPIVVALVGAVMMIRSWGTWPDCVVDFGRELYVPWQLSEGKVLYRDIVSYFNGPLSPYLHAGLFKLFGASLQTLVVFNLLVIASVATLLYALLARAAGRVAASAGGVLFFILFAFAQLRFAGNFNFVCPYSYELTHGIELTLFAIFCLDRWVRSDRRAWLIAGAATLGLVWLTKAEVALAATATLATGVLANLWLKQFSRRRAIVEIAVSAGATIVVVGIALLWLMIHLSAGEALRGVAGAWRWLGERSLLDMPYFKDLAGTRDVAESLRIIATWSAGYGVLFVLPAAAGLLFRKRGRGPAIVAMALFLALITMGVWFWPKINWDNFLRPMPLLMLVACLMLGRRILKRSGDSPRCVLSIALLVFALTLLAKIALNAHIYHYGFALAMPATVVGAAMLIGWMPAAIDRAGGCGNYLRATVLAALVIVCGVHVRAMEQLWANKTVMVGAGADAFLADWRGEIVDRMLNDLMRGTPRDATVAVVPEGLILNYLARRENPTGQLNFTPPALVMYGKDRMLEAFRTHPPDYVVVAGVDTAEYGPRFFGTDYAQELGAWFQDNYIVIHRVGALPFREPGFGMLLLKRKAPSS
ncbi:hypothetical protein BH09PLA1_BH09PLA1_07910 [soil metagenome]